jgi:predicted MPP superfamily phosphohydrolase
MIWLVLMLFLAALIADAYIYRSVICPRFDTRPARVTYIVFAAVTDVPALSAFLLYAFSPLQTTGIIVVMWLVWIFFFVSIPKLLYLTGGFLDFLVKLVSRRRLFVFRGLSLAVSVVVMVAMIRGATVGRTGLRVERVEVCSERVPAAFDGYRIVQFSDTHIGTMARPAKRLARLVAAVGELGGDMVVNTGDLVNITHAELTPEVMELLGGITAPDGVWSAWGNHDLGFYIKEGSALTPEANLAALSEKVRAMGWRTLSDSAAWIRRGADSLLLVGLDYPRDPMLNAHNESLAGVDISAAFEGVEGEPFNIVLAHTPKLWDGIKAHGRGDVTLAGHVHTMQAKLRIFGRMWSPAQYMYREWSGKYVSEECGKKSLLYINDGTGCVGYPMRIGAKARGEITVFTLKRRCE